MEKNHMLWMILGCAIPMGIITVLPLFGITSSYTAIVAIVIMIVLLMFMMGGYVHNHKHKAGNKE